MDILPNIPAKIGYISLTIYPVDKVTKDPVLGSNITLLQNGSILLKTDWTVGRDGNYTQIELTDIDVNQDLQLIVTAPGYKEAIFNTFEIIDLQFDPLVYLTKTGNNFLPIALAGLALLAVTEDKKIGAANTGKNNLINAGLLIGGGYVLIKAIGIADNLLELLGLQKSVETRTLDFASTDPNSFWNPNFWRQFSNWNYALTANQARSIISQLKSAFSWFNDDEAAAIAALKQLKTQSNLSYISYVFSADEGKDFLTWLRGDAYPNDRLSDAEIYDLHNYIAKLPTH